jgi:hypothetical protein
MTTHNRAGGWLSNQTKSYGTCDKASSGVVGMNEAQTAMRLVEMETLKHRARRKSLRDVTTPFH